MAAPFAPGHTIVELQTSRGDIWIELYDQEAPKTVANFLNYVTNNRYDDTVVHRDIPGFVLQMGGYTVTDEDRAQHIETFPPVQNEFSASRSNVLRTVAMAKSPDLPNSATSEFFFNLGDNASNLDNQNGGFTVFGQVVNGWDVVLDIVRLRTVDLSADLGGAFSDTPVTTGPSDFVTAASLVRITDVVTITSPGWDQHGNGGRNVMGSATINSETLFVTVNPLGRPIAFYQSSPNAAWQVSDIGLQTSAPAIAGQVITWADPKDGRFYVAAPTASGLLLFTRNSDGFWKARNLNDENPNASIFPVGNSLTVFTSRGDALAANNDIVTIAGLNAQGEIVLFTQASKTATNGNYPWAFVNLHTRDLVPNGQATPAFVGPLTSYVTTWNGQNIAGLDSNGQVQVVWWSPALTNWRTDNLSAQTGAPAMTGGLTPYLTPWGGINLAGTDASGNVVVTWWGGPADTVDWKKNNFTQEFGGAPLVVGSLTSYVTPWGGLNVTGTTSDGRIVIYWWGGPEDHDLPVWKVTPLSDAVSGSVPVEGRIFGLAAPNGQINLTGLAANGDVLRYNWKPGEAVWNMQNLTVLATFW